MLTKLRRIGWFAAIAGLLGSAMFAGCEVAQKRWGCALAAGIVAVAAAVLLVLRLCQ